jgi:hypothetical protein
MNRPYRIAVVILSLFAIGATGRDTRQGELDRVADEHIDATSLMEIVELLASPEMAGRLSGTEGYDRAAMAMAERFGALGLEPGGDDGYLQQFTIEANTILGQPRLAVTTTGEPRALQHGQDFIARGFSGSGQVEAPVVFVGYGLTLPELGWDDYAGRDLTGKIVLALKQPPPWEHDGGSWGEAHLPRPKAINAAAHGAAGLLLVSRPDENTPQALYASVQHGPGEQNETLPLLHVSGAAADSLLANSGSTLSDLQKRIDEARAPVEPIDLGVTASIDVQARYQREAPTMNVVAILPGTDDSLAGSHLVVGGHLDHVGQQGDLIYPGANDNASGAAAVLAVARAFVLGDVRSKRTVVFVLFAGEEQGMHGAEAYAANPALPLERGVAMLNTDCPGEGDALRIACGNANPELWGIGAAAAQRRAGATLTHGGCYGGGCDGQPFFDAGLPTLWFALANGGTFLHQPGDTPDTLDPDLFAEEVRLLFLTAAEIADGRYAGEERVPPESGS